jgi:hypothetical protein
VQQDADVISAMAEVDEADAMFDDEDDEFEPEASCRYCRFWNDDVYAPEPDHGRCNFHGGYSADDHVCRNWEASPAAGATDHDLSTPATESPLSQARERLAEKMRPYDWWTGQYSVEISRIRPRYTSNGSVCTGLVATLNQSVDINFIESHFGGGTYDITIRGGLESSGHRRFLRGCRITIAGEPKVLGLEPEPATPAPVPAQAKTMLERVIDRKRNPVMPCSDVVLSTDKPTRLVEAVEEPDDIDS